ncbi:hypothetical protein MMC34_008521 [Xylographa carneopallida]|nr:hypothetical protein [Xylographa carneopallida]
MSGARAKGKVVSSARSSLDVATVDELLSEVPSSFHTARDFNPFSHYDDSVSELGGYSGAVREAIELVVEAHYKGFNQATAAFTHVVQQFASAQGGVQQLQTQLADSKRLLTARNDRLREQWRQAQTLTHINHSLAKLTYLVTLPAHLSVLEERKQYLHCVVLLTHTLSALSDEDMREVEGLLELREDTINRRNNIVDALLQHTQQLLYHKHSADGAHSIAHAANADSAEAVSAHTSHASSSISSSGVASSSADNRTVSATGSEALSRAEAAAIEGSAPSTSAPTAGSLSLSAEATMAYLTSNVLSPFHPSKVGSLDFALSDDSSVLSDPAWRSISSLLRDERSSAFVSAPFAQPQLALSLVVAALDHINALPSAKLQLSRAVRVEVSGILHDIKQHIKRSSASRRKKRIVAEGGQASGELSPSLKPLASPGHGSTAPLAASAAHHSAPSRSSALTAHSSILSEPSTALPRVASPDRLTLAELLSQAFAALMAALRMHHRLIHATALMQRARRDVQAALDASQQPQRQQQAADKRKAAAGKKESGSSEREDSRWSVLHVWSTMQSELEALLQELLTNSADSQLQLSSSTSSSSVGGNRAASADAKAGKKGAGGELELTFSFDAASAPSIARMSRGKDDKSLSAQMSERRQHQAALRREQRALVPASPYNITVLYRPVLHFCRQVQLLCEAAAGAERGETSEASLQLLSFLDRFVQSSFLPRLQADVNIRLDAILSDEHAFDEWELPSDAASQQSTSALLLKFFQFADSQSTASRSLQSHALRVSAPSARLRCCVGVCELVELLLSDANTLPAFAAEYVSVVDGALNRLQTACHDRYVDACRGVYSTNRLMDSALVTAMEHETPYTHIIMQQPQQQQTRDGADTLPGSSSTPSLLSSLSSSSPSPLFAPLLSPDFSLRPEQLLSDARSIVQLCLLHSSLDWLCDRLLATVTAQSQRKAAAVDNSASSPSLRSLVAGGLSQAAHSTFRLNAHRLKEEASLSTTQRGHKQTQAAHEC